MFPNCFRYEETRLEESCSVSNNHNLLKKSDQL